LDNPTRKGRFALALTACVLVTLVSSATAYANFGPHAPATSTDTDSCAACHRSHTSMSSVGWSDALGTQHASALLVGSATSMTEFCNACHGNGAPGASTNVQAGIFDAGPSSATSSTFNAPLNAGGFEQMPNPYVWESSATVVYKAATSAHNMEAGAQPLWGAGNSLATSPNLSCTSCHDAHWTSNYRLLKASVNTTIVGGYAADGQTSNAFVFSAETGFPIPGVDPSNTAGGFLKRAAGAAQVAAYRPDYTGGTKLLNVTATTPNKSMSVWCASCHRGYRQISAATSVSADYGIYEVNTSTAVPVGTRVRHLHPVDQTLAAGWGVGRSLQDTVVSDPFWLPLEANGSGSSAFYQDYIGCLTCHRAHGSSADMTGWAAASLTTNTAGTWVPVMDGVPGVNPAKQVAGGSTAVGSSALLRANNRGVCERCHNK
jgi:hypothetical protein